jgi:microcystin-dependent protein
LSDPTKFTASYNFSGFQSVSPDTPLPGTQVDIQLAAIEASTLSLVNAVKGIRRSDGALANQSVGPDQLADSLVIGFTLRGTWVDATAYSAGDGVVYGTSFYKALSAHTSSVATRPDTDDETWEFLLTFESIIVADGAITPAKLSADAAGFRTKIGLGTLAVEDVEYLDERVAALDEKVTIHDDDVFYGLDSEALDVGKKVKWSTFIAMMQAALVAPTPVGGIIEFGGTTAPTGWLLCYGQAVSRTTYSALFAVLGTAHGAGDGSTTFNVPDHRGRVVAGLDNMGGSSANRLTNQTGGLNGDTLGATGGLETHTLTTAQLASHTHQVNPPSATTSSDGAHTHSLGLTNDFGDGNDALVGDGPRDFSTTTGSDGSHTHTLNITEFASAAAGSGSAHNNVQPTIVETKIIYTGVA